MLARGSLEAWVWRIALREALRAREQGRSAAREVDALDLHLVDNDRDRQPTAAIRSLAPRRRLIVFLRYFADLSYSEIAIDVLPP